jgi:uncharacterized protein YdeI (YjbR/CyaY-like superfamily)
MGMLSCKNRSVWRAWLRKNGGKRDEIWLLYYKNKSGQPSIGYEDAVEEALCFGWIDGKIKRIDEASYAQRFTPRRPGSRWSAINIRRAERMIAQGRMTAAGRKAFRSGRRRESPRLPARLPQPLQNRFELQKDAWENFQRFPPYYRRLTIGWIASAKKEETQLKRLAKLIDYSARHQRIKFM